MIRMLERPLVLLSLVLCLVPASAWAILPPTADTPGGSVKSQLTSPRFILQASGDAAWNEAISASDSAFASFRQAAGGTWHARYDRRTLRPALIWGSGVPWIPGRGNSLTWSEVVRGAPPQAREEILAVLEKQARSFMAEQADLLRIPDGIGELGLDPTRSGTVGDGKVWYLTFAPRPGDVEVERAAVLFRLNSGNLVQFGTTMLGDALSTVPTVPVFGADHALALAQERMTAMFATPGVVGPSPFAVEEVLNPGSLSIIPWTDSPRSYDGPPGDGLDYRLVWRVAFVASVGVETWAAQVDAVTGALVTLYDSNLYQCAPPASPQGRVTGGVYLGPIEQVPESVRGMPFADVINRNPITTDYNGLYPYDASSSSETGLNGAFFDMGCDGCSNPPNAFVQNIGGGELFLGTGGVNEVGNGRSTRAERNCFYHLGVVRQLAHKHLDNAAVNNFFNRNTPAIVNIVGQCNAFWNGNGVNFFRAGGGCNNLGEIADVMQHEWGHGLDQFTGNAGDGARGEGMSDIVAWLSTHDERLGPYFVMGNANGIRHADENVAPEGVLTISNLLTECPGGGGPSGGQVHCEGQIFSQTFWHLARNLRQKATAAGGGEQAGWFATERLFFQSLPTSDTYVPDQATSAYDAVVLVDDDNGNLADGTPNGAEIANAFLHHETASTPQVGDSADCAPPAAPSITLQSQLNAATSLWQVEVTWNAVPTAVEYLVTRNDAAGTTGDVPVATIFPPATTFLDDNVTDDVTYFYRVQVFDAAGCASIVDNQQSITVGSLAHLGLESFTFDDSAGNLNGLADPGETLDVSLQVRNDGSGQATMVVATVSSPHPGVTVTQPSTSFGDLASGTIGANLAPNVVVQLDPTLVSCGQFVPFTIEMAAVEGCSTAGFLLPVGELIGFNTLRSDDFETDQGWTVDPDGTDDATTGIWVREDPNPTMTGGGAPRQPDDDVTPAPGVTCWITGNDPATGAGNDDVDDGCTTLQSPVFDMGMTGGLVLSYWRYFIERADLGDELVIEISNDGGNSWLPLETLPDRDEQWTQVVHDLDTVLGAPADRVVIRVNACDNGPGTLFEALIDDFEIREPIFQCEAPDARPRLALAAYVVADDPLFGGDGNADGVLDPGELVRIPFDLTNGGNADATNVVGTLALASGPAGSSVTDAAAEWPDIVISAVERSGAGVPPHFEITVPAGTPCMGSVTLDLVVTYDGPAGSYMLAESITIDVGIDVDTDIFFDDFDGGTDNGWTHGTNCAGGGCDPQDDWQRGPPLTTSQWDPTAGAFSGANVWGNDLGDTIGGNQSNGDYQPDVDNFLESPSFDCSGLTGVRISFQRWLSVEGGAFDRARILVNGTEIWSNPAGADLIDTAWTLVEYDISALADGNPDVRIRFELAADGGLQYGGWNIDDFRISWRDRVCTTACNASGMPGPVGSVLRPTLVNYDEDTVEFSWAGAPLGTDEFYRVYRGTAPDALGMLVSPPLLIDTNFIDASAPDGLYYYRVILADCTGAEGPFTP